MRGGSNTSDLFGTELLWVSQVLVGSGTTGQVLSPGRGMAAPECQLEPQAAAGPAALSSASAPGQHHPLIVRGIMIFSHITLFGMACCSLQGLEIPVL